MELARSWRLTRLKGLNKNYSVNLKNYKEVSLIYSLRYLFNKGWNVNVFIVGNYLTNYSEMLTFSINFVIQYQFFTIYLKKY